MVNASASPYHVGKGAFREGLLADRASETGAAFALCNLVGGQDELVFDGHSLVVSGAGEVLARGAQFEEDLVLCDLELPAAADAVPGPSDSAPVVARFDLSPPDYEARPAPGAAHGGGRRGLRSPCYGPARLR